jgi:hypothetical protein
MRWLWIGYGVALLLAVVGAVLWPTLNLGWVVLGLVLLGIGIMAWLFMRPGAPDDKFPWE